jgi:hypothetical protein
MITQEELKEFLNYDPNTGIFKWKKIGHTSNKKIGDIAGGLCLGYVVIKLKDKQYKAHRLAWLYIYGKWPKDQIDHINGNKSDNKINNLREVNQSQNNFNRKLQKNNTTGVKGVTFNKAVKKWQVSFKINKNPMYFGVFENFEFACLIADEVREKYHKQFLRN